MKKVFIIVWLVVCLIITLFAITKDNYKLDPEIEEIIDGVNKLHSSYNSKAEAIIVSLSDGQNKAKVFCSNKANYQNDIKKEIAKNYNQSYKWIRIDYVKNIGSINSNLLSNTIKSKTKNYFNNGIIITNDNRKIFLLPEELNLNSIIDYGGAKLNINNLNQYLEYRNERTIDRVDGVATFDTDTFFCDIENKDGIIEFVSVSSDIKIRKDNDSFFDNKAYDVNRIISMENPYNKDTFIYQMNPLGNNLFDEYTIIRHLLGTYAIMLVDYEVNQELINRKIDYLLNQIVFLDENTCFVKEEGDNELKLGASGLALITLSEYYQNIKDKPEYTDKSQEILEYLKKIGNGISTFQKLDGSFNHVLYEDSFKVKSKFRVNYYDGEAVYGLCKLYGATKDETYLRSAIKALNFFYENNYVDRGDHWVEYALNEMLKYNYDRKYVYMANENAKYSLNRIKDNKLTYSDFETIAQLSAIYNMLKSKEYLERFNIEEDLTKLFNKEFDKYLKKAKDLMTGTYMFPELAMYLNDPAKYIDFYFVREGDYRIRIDDVAHSIMGSYELFKFNSKK